MHLTYHKSLGADRIAILTGALSFDDVVEMIYRATISGYLFERASSTRLKGLRRASFLLEVPQETYDLFFNSLFGYRAQYAISPESGMLANRKLIDRLAGRLIEYASSHESASAHDMTTSLAATDAKVWILESEVEAQMWSADPAIHYQPWESATKNGAGLLAPIGSKLEVKGGWLDPSGRVQRDPSKATRGDDIHAVGYS
jgi:hypothetical protein